MQALQKINGDAERRVSVGVLRLLNFQRRFEFKAYGRLGRQHDVFVAGESGAGATRACTCKRADRRAFATTRQPADDCAESGTATSEYSSSLALAFFRARNRGGLNGAFFSINRDGVQLDLQNRSTFEFAKRLGIGDDSAGGRTGGNHCLAINRDGS